MASEPSRYCEIPLLGNPPNLARRRKREDGGMTLFETLYMGVPYVTLAGRPSVGRLGSSILQGVGHGEWIARSEEEYVQKVVSLAGDVPGLGAIRSRLRGQMQASALMDEAGFARKVEAAYREMFVSWAGRPECR